MKRRTIAVCLLLCAALAALLLTACGRDEPTQKEPSAAAPVLTDEQGLIFTAVGEDAFAVTGAGDSLPAVVTVPATFEGKPVTKIGWGAFRGNAKLANITLPESVTEIEAYAFATCAALATVNLPEGLTAIGESAFLYCPELARIRIPAGVTEIAPSTFRGCYLLSEVTFAADDRLTAVGDYAFSSCYILREITIPASVTRIGFDAFGACSSLFRVGFPASLSELGAWAFRECVNLREVDLPAGVVSVGEGAFRNCSRLRSLTLPASLTSVGNYAFFECSQLLEVRDLSTLSVQAGETGNGHAGYYARAVLHDAETPSRYFVDDAGYVFYTEDEHATLVGCDAPTADMTLPADCRGVPYEIGDYALSAHIMATVVIPEGVTRIGDRAFYGCSSLSSVTFAGESALVEIGEWAFADCIALTKITIPAGVDFIGARAFYRCEKLTGATFAVTAGWTAGEEAVTLTSNAAANAALLSRTRCDVVWRRA